MLGRRLLLPVLVLAVHGCGGTPSLDPGTDSGVTRPDAGSPMDAGTDAGYVADSGVMDAGVDAGLDAGSTVDAGVDAGTPDAGPVTCASTAQCGIGRWCDQGRCAPLCVPGGCSGGRVCEPVTRTCMFSCTSGCDGGVCDVASNVCRAPCDGFPPCAAGFFCNPATAACEPECGPARACPTFKVCNGGACVNVAQCALDSDCSADRLCVGGTCVTRPTGRNDAGAFTCAHACDCRADEMCRFDLGVCVNVTPPTLYFYPDAGGTGLFPSTPAGSLEELTSRAVSPDIVALLWDAGTIVTQAITPDAGVTIAGGYVDCGPTRWVRDDSRRTPVGSLENLVFRLDRQNQEDVTLRNLEVVLPVWPLMLEPTAINAEERSRLLIENAALRIVDAGSIVPFPQIRFLRCLNCQDLQIRGLTVLPVHTTARLELLDLAATSGVIDGLKVADFNTTGVDVKLIKAFVNRGPLTVRRSEIGAMSAYDSILFAFWCTTFRLNFHENTVHWASTVNGAARESLVQMIGCPEMNVTDNFIHGTTSVTLPSDQDASRAFEIWDSSGLIARNVVTFPVGTGGATAFDLFNGTTKVELSNNVVSGGAGLDFAYPLRIRNVAVGPIDVHDNVFGATADVASGLVLHNVLAAAGLRVHDNVFRVTGLGDGHVRAVSISDATVVLERNQFEANRGGATHALFASGNSYLEAYQNTWVAGPAFGGGVTSATVGFELLGGGEYFFVGNSIDLRPDVAQPGRAIALRCDSTQADVFTSNIFGSTSAPNRTLVDGNACLVAGSFTRNHFWYAAPGGLGANDVTSAIAVDAGNQLAPGINPYAAFGSFDLAAGSACIDTGAAGPQRDGGYATLDVNRRPRIVDGGADIGAVEQQ